VSETVVDASAVLALLQQEPGQDVVAATIETAIISTVNLAEVFSRLLAHMDAEVAGQAVAHLRLETVDFTASQARITGTLRGETRHLGLSLGDRACLALAMERSLPVLTTDRSWAKLQLPVDIRLAR
jgi:ribonuclease VapC